MKKLFPLLILCCLSFAGFAQYTNTVSVNATGASGSYKTGYTQAASGRVDGDLLVGDASPVTATRGYAVFDLSGVVPAGATVDSVYIRFNYKTANTSTYVRGKIYGMGLDFSTVTSSPTLFADCANGAYFDSSHWGASLTGAVDNIGFNNNGISFVQGQLGNKISIGFVTDTPGNTYTITGEGGSAATQPKLTIKYHCTGVAGVAATANPNPVCKGSTFMLLGAGTGASTYAWSGPSSYSSTLQNPTLPIIATDTTVGVYHYTAYNAAGCATSVITYVVQSVIPARIHGPSSVCAGYSIVLTDSTAGGFWSVTPSTAGTITSGGVFIAGIDSNTAHISYTLSDGCSAHDSVGVMANPQPIVGTTTLCSGLSSTLTDPTPSGTWSVSPTSVATITSGGVLTAHVFLGLTTYSATITYTLPTGCKITAGATVLPQPGPITGATILCAPTSTTLSDAYSGSWSSTASGIASVNSSGVVTGISYGVAIIKYTNPYGCFVSSPMYVATTAPAPITGPTSVCPILTDSLRDAVPGGFWQSGSANATVDTNGVVRGISAGVAPISYYNGCGMASVNITVTTPPAHMTGNFHVCVGSTTTLSDVTTPGVWTGSDGTKASVAAGFGAVSGISYGGLIITYTSPVTGCIDTANFMVDSIPQPILATAFHTCPGDNINFYDSTTGGAWSSHDGTIATVNGSGLVTGVSANTTTITYALPSTGCYVTANILVNPNPSPIMGAGAICQGLLDTVSDATLNGTWTGNPTGVASIGSISGAAIPSAFVSGTTGGTFTISYTLPTGCRATATETIHPTPNPTFTYNGALATLYTQTTYVTYQWFKNGVPIVGATTWSIAGLTDGTYTVFVTDVFGCQVLSSPYILTNVGVPVVSSGATVNIFPNPANSTVNIQCPVAVRAMITSMDGKLMIEKSNAASVDISGLATGVYLISVYDEAGARLTVQKLIKE